MDGESRSRPFAFRSWDWFVPQALSFGYFSLGKQRKVTRAAQPIGSFASFLRQAEQINFKIKMDSSFRWNDERGRTA